MAFDFYSDTPAGKDPDDGSPALRRCHAKFWSKPLRSGELFLLEAPSSRREGYLCRTDSAGRKLWFGSDAITNSYTRWTRPRKLADAIASLDEDQRLRYLNPPYTFGQAMIWPVRTANRPTLNQARGTRPKIADRMDLTLECIRRYYSGQAVSPLADVITAYRDFFGLFEDFREFVDFFLLQDLVTDEYAGVRFHLPLDDFVRPGAPQSRAEYVTYREATLEFVDARQQRMDDWAAYWLVPHTSHGLRSGPKQRRRDGHRTSQEGQLHAALQRCSCGPKPSQLRCRVDSIEDGPRGTMRVEHAASTVHLVGRNLRDA